MPQLTLYAPDITCDHCIATIRKTVEARPGARFLAGDADARQFTIEVDRGAVLDDVAAALAGEGYPLGPAVEVARGTAPPAVGPASKATHPDYRVTRTDAGAEINYDCPCGCVAGFAYNRALAEQEPESCCCGRTLLVGRDAATRLRAALADSGGYSIDVQTLTMPWGQPLEVALATPLG